MQQFHLEQSQKLHEREERLMSFLEMMERKLIRARAASPPADRPYTPSIMLTKRVDDTNDYDEKKDDFKMQAYPSLPFAAGLRLMKKDLMCTAEWKPAWKVFPLKAFRGSSFTYMKIYPHWDDEALLSELNRTYDKLRTVWRKWFSLRGVRYGNSILVRTSAHSVAYSQLDNDGIGMKYHICAFATSQLTPYTGGSFLCVSTAHWSSQGAPVQEHAPALSAQTPQGHERSP